MIGRFSERLLAGNAWFHPLVRQRFPEPVGAIGPVCQQPLRFWQIAQQGCCTGLITYLTCCHEEAERADLSIGDGMHLCVHAALGAAD